MQSYSGMTDLIYTKGMFSYRMINVKLHSGYER